MSQDLTHLPRRETSLLVYADEVCYKRSIDSYLSKSKEEGNYVMDMGWGPCDTFQNDNTEHANTLHEIQWEVAYMLQSWLHP